MSYRRIERLGAEYGLIYNNKTRKFNTHKLHRAALYAEKEASTMSLQRKPLRPSLNMEKMLLTL